MITHLLNGYLICLTITCILIGFGMLSLLARPKLLKKVSEKFGVKRLFETPSVAMIKLIAMLFIPMVNVVSSLLLLAFIFTDFWGEAE